MYKVLEEGYKENVHILLTEQEKKKTERARRERDCMNTSIKRDPMNNTWLLALQFNQEYSRAQF